MGAPAIAPSVDRCHRAIPEGLGNELIAARMSRSFFVALALATALPLIALPSYGLSHLIAPVPIVAAVYGVWVLTGFGHVTSTVWFGVDPDYRPVVRAHRLRMLACLAVIPVAMAAITLADRTMSTWLYAGFLAWQAHHFSRQNYGILSFAAANDRFGPLPREVGLITNITSAAGAMGMVTMPSIYPKGLPRLPLLTPTLAVYGHVAAIVCFVAAAGLTAWLLVKDRRLRRSPTVLLFLGLSGVFFSPSLLHGPPVMAFWPYAMAHGAQYLIVMANTSRTSPFGWVGFAIFAVGAACLGAAAIALPGPVLIQAFTGIVIWHFLADARLWRLRDPVVRAIVRRRFSFVFEVRPATSPIGISLPKSAPQET